MTPKSALFQDSLGKKDYVHVERERFYSCLAFTNHLLVIVKKAPVPYFVWLFTHSCLGSDPYYVKPKLNRSTKKRDVNAILVQTPSFLQKGYVVAMISDCKLLDNLCWLYLPNSMLKDDPNFRYP